MKNGKLESPIERMAILSNVIVSPLEEIVHGIRAGTMPWNTCLSACIGIQLVLLTGMDECLWGQFSHWIHGSFQRYQLYYFSCTSLPFIAWGMIQTGKKRQLAARLTEIFDASGLRNKLGKCPNFIFDQPLDSSTRKLRLTRAVLDLKDFERAKSSLEGGLQIYIDEFRENRTAGTIDMIYSNHPMPEQFELADIRSIPKGKFVVGTTRSGEIRVSIESVPHLLVAGQTGGGKSTFLRQFITTQYLNDQGAKFVLVDLKGGMEFQLFENLPRVTVPENTKLAIEEVETLSETLDKRMAFLKEQKCKDIQEFHRRVKEEPKAPRPAIALQRHYIVVDEAAEMFLAGHHATGHDVQKAKRVLSRIARQGRAVGIHLIVATQRPDSRALDPQIKANLTGAICFQMANDISSITVIGNGRATDLPAVPGRAIWKSGADMVEIQTPLLTASQTEEMVREFQVTDAPSKVKAATLELIEPRSKTSLIAEMEQHG